jgi:hypothetical protein
MPSEADEAPPPAGSRYTGHGRLSTQATQENTLLDSAGSSGTQDQVAKQKRSVPFEWDVVSERVPKWMLKGRDCPGDSAGKSDAVIASDLLEFERLQVNQVSADLAIRQLAMQKQEAQSAQRVRADEVQCRASCKQHIEKAERSFDVRRRWVTDREEKVAIREEALETEEATFMKEWAHSLDAKELSLVEWQSKVSRREASVPPVEERYQERVISLTTRSVRSRLLVWCPASFRGMMVYYGELTGTSAGRRG